MEEHTYHRPETLDEALNYRSALQDAIVIAGGTDLVAQRKGKLAEAPILSLRAIPELAKIRANGNVLHVGAMTQLHDLGEHAAIKQHFPALREAISCLGSRQIRNVATIGGNLCNASPSADTAPPLIVYGAQVEITSRSGSRILPLEDFFKGPGMTDLRPDEILTAVLLETPEPTSRCAFLRRGRIKMDIATASLALAMTVDGNTCKKIKLCAGAVGPTPLRLPNTEAILMGQTLGPELITKACESASNEVRPIDDIRSSAQYRRDLIGVFLKRAIAKASSGEVTA